MLRERAYSTRVFQAQGMVSVQADCTLDAAFEMLACMADATDETVDVVAAFVVSREVRFDNPD